MEFKDLQKRVLTEITNYDLRIAKELQQNERAIKNITDEFKDLDPDNAYQLPTNKLHELVLMNEFLHRQVRDNYALYRKLTEIFEEYKGEKELW